MLSINIRFMILFAYFIVPNNLIANDKTFCIHAGYPMPKQP